MSRRPAQHAKSTSGYDARHARPGMPGPAILIGTAAKAVPATLVAGAAGSALALSGTAQASAATVMVGAPAGASHNATPHLPTAHLTRAQLPRAFAPRAHAHHVAHRTSYTVRSGDTLSRISARFCGTSADYQSLAAASGISNADVIYPGQTVKLDCHTAIHATLTAAVGRHAHRRPDPHPERPAGAHRAPGRHAHGSRGHSGFSTAGMAAFEACVISRESGGNPEAVNPYSGAGGLFQFLPSTWAALGYGAAYPGGAQTAPVGVQEDAFNKLYAEAGTSPWAPYDGC